MLLPLLLLLLLQPRVFESRRAAGHSLKFLTHALREHGLRTRVFGFDSFEGLPEEAAPPELAASGGDKAFRRGEYNAADALKTSSWPELRQRVLRYINHPVAGEVELIRGFFNESLTPTLAHEAGMRPALWCDLDVDQYVGTMQAFEWMLASGLIVRGTYVSFDDFNDEYDTEPGWACRARPPDIDGPVRHPLAADLQSPPTEALLVRGVPGARSGKAALAGALPTAGSSASELRRVT